MKIFLLKPQYYYSEQVLSEFEGPISRGRWWEWMPVWARPLQEFSAQVLSASKLCYMKHIELAQLLISLCGNGLFFISEIKSREKFIIPVWEIEQLLVEWIFYELSPTLRMILENSEKIN